MKPPMAAETAAEGSGGKHTPGLWHWAVYRNRKLSPPTEDDWNCTGDSFKSPMLVGADEAVVLDPVPMHGSEAGLDVRNPADRALIAAAPELLEAATELLKVQYGGTYQPSLGCDCATCKLSAAIALATGAAQ
jgi:hypothetical protein